MRCLVFVPTGVHSSNPNVTPSTKAEVDVETLDELFEKLTNEAPENTRVVAYTPAGTIHYVMNHRGEWVKRLQVIVA